MFFCLSFIGLLEIFRAEGVHVKNIECIAVMEGLQECMEKYDLWFHVKMNVMNALVVPAMPMMWSGRLRMTEKTSTNVKIATILQQFMTTALMPLVAAFPKKKSTFG